jgi:hypothetical protein
MQILHVARNADETVVGFLLCKLHMRTYYSYNIRIVTSMLKWGRDLRLEMTAW